MKHFEKLKKISAFVIFMSITPLAGQNIITINEQLPFNTEKLEIKFPRAVWFGKSKVSLGNYAVANIKEGPTSNETRRKRGVYISETKFKFSIILKNSQNSTATLEARTVENSEYVVLRKNLEGIFLGDVLGTETESEKILDMAIYPKNLKATIKTNLEESSNWDFLLRKPDPYDISNEEIGILTDGERSIYVIQSNLECLKNMDKKDLIQLNKVFYEFIENGISLCKVTYDNENSIWLKPDLDQITKLILCISMLSLRY